MARRIPVRNTDKTRVYQSDIRIINQARAKLGKRSLPLRNTTWYENVLDFSKKFYQDSELATKMISLSISPYEANIVANNQDRLKTTTKRTSKKGKTLDEAIRYKDYNDFDSVSVNRYRNDEARREDYFDNIGSSVIIVEQLNIKGIKV